MKTIFFPFIVAIMIWFWNRVHMLARKPVLLERMLMTIGFALTLLNRKQKAKYLCSEINLQNPYS